jgi:hypothetical protein
MEFLRWLMFAIALIGYVGVIVALVGLLISNYRRIPVWLVVLGACVFAASLCIGFPLAIGVGFRIHDASHMDR